MLSELFEALVAHLSPMQLPVFLADHVPDGTPLPYAALDVQPSALPGAAGTLALTLWAHSHAQRLQLAEDLARLMPADGFVLHTPQADATLRMTGTLRCVHARSAQGLQAAWTLRLYPARKEIPHDFRP